MSSEGSDTHWFDLLTAGNRTSAQPLWERKFGFLVACARAASGTSPHRASRS
jgi:hypothetical protein